MVSTPENHPPKSQPESAQSACAQCAELAAKLEAAEQRVEEHLGGWKRAKADYINLKREQEKHFAELAAYAHAELILQVLPVLDDLKLAVRHIPQEAQAQNWVQGIVQVVKGFEARMKTMGVETISTVGIPFDPSKHEAVATVEKSGKASNIVVEEVTAGYAIRGQVIRPAKVKVAK